MRERITTDIKTAMRGKDALTLEVLRMIQAAIGNLEIEKRTKKEEVTDLDIIAVIKKEVKKRRESIDIYTKAARPELAEKEANELAILQKYLPEEMNEAAIEKIVEKVIAAGGEGFGPIMQAVMKEVAGRAEGRLVGEVIKKHL